VYPHADTLVGVSSRHARIQVPCDPELQEAIARGRDHIGRGAPTSQVVRALALRGAATLRDDEDAARRAADFLVAAAEGRSGLDLEGLRTARDRAWK
jgi:hypothetical protein